MTDDIRTLRLAWMDLEMTGLDPATCTILEIATIVTDADLNILAQGPELAVHHPDAVLEAMDEWNTSHHTASGLVARVRESSVSLAEAERQTLEFLREHLDEGEAPLCGNSIGQDRRFLRAHMPDLHAYFHYRSVDVSSIKELVYRWYPPGQRARVKKSNHRALDDIQGSIEELRYYREHIFV